MQILKNLIFIILESNSLVIDFHLGSVEIICVQKQCTLKERLAED